MAATKALTPRSLVNAIDRSMGRIDFAPDGTILDANRNFTDLMGYSLEEIRGRHHSIFVDEAVRSIPPGFNRYLEELVIDVEDMPDEATCEELNLRDTRTLLGLYRGTPLTHRHVDAPYRYPERIVIYQRNIERMCRSKRRMVTQIRRTVLHEIGHHFGLSERQLRELGYA